MINIAVPFTIDGRGRTSLADHPSHLLDLLELFLFTNPKERVNRPDFGSGLRAMIFNKNSLELAAALKFNLQANLQRYLGDLIQIGALEVVPLEEKLVVDLQYRVRNTGPVQTARFPREV